MRNRLIVAIMLMMAGSVLYGCAAVKDTVIAAEKTMASGLNSVTGSGEYKYRTSTDYEWINSNTEKYYYGTGKFSQYHKMSEKPVYFKTMLGNTINYQTRLGIPVFNEDYLNAFYITDKSGHLLVGLALRTNRYTGAFHIHGEVMIQANGKNIKRGVSTKSELVPKMHYSAPYVGNPPRSIGSKTYYMLFTFEELKSIAYAPDFRMVVDDAKNKRFYGFPELAHWTMAKTFQPNLQKFVKEIEGDPTLLGKVQ